MPISGDDKAPTYARLGVMRLGATRLDYYPPHVKVAINGVDRAANMRISGVTINDYLDGTPNTMTCRVEGFTPTVGHEIKLALGELDTAHMLFAGHIVEMTQIYEGLQANVAFDLTCIDYTWLLDRKLVTKTYSVQSATTIAKDLISTYTSGFTSTGVESGLDTIDEITFTDSTVSDALNQLAKRGGWYWVVNADKVLRFGSTLDDGTAVPITDTVKAGMRDLKWTTDLSQVRTRVRVVGKSTTALGPALGGILPVTDASSFGTLAQAPNGQRFTITSASGFGGVVHYVRPATLGTAAAGSTSLTLENVGGTPSASLSGAWLLIGGVAVYADRLSLVSGFPTWQDFLDIPAAGEPGCLSVDVPAGTIVTLCDTISNIAGGISVDIAAGDEISSVTTVNDTAAQTAMAAAVGGDGIHEDAIVDGRIGSSEQSARGNARLDLVSDPHVTARYGTRDQSTKSGRTVSFTLGAPTSLNGTLRIQSVTITEVGRSATVFPLRQVEASSRRYSFEDLLRQIKGDRVA